MWLVSEPEIVKRRYESGAGLEAGHGLVSGELGLARRLEYIDWNATVVQVVTCDQCGQPGCAPGNFIELRRAGDYVVWAPSLRAYDARDINRSQYDPPHWVRRRGFAVFDATGWDRLSCSLGKRVPAHREMSHLSWRQAWLIAQHESQRPLFGEPGSESSGDLSELVATDPFVEPAQLSRLFHSQTWAAEDATTSIELAIESDAVAMYFDRYPDEARVLSLHDGAWRLHMGAFSIYPA